MAERARADDLDVNFYVSDDTPDASVRDALQPLIDAGLPVLYRQYVPALHDVHDEAPALLPVLVYDPALQVEQLVMQSCKWSGSTVEMHSNVSQILTQQTHKL